MKPFNRITHTRRRYYPEPRRHAAALAEARVAAANVARSLVHPRVDGSVGARRVPTATEIRAAMTP